jgi:hypothetical protein
MLRSLSTVEPLPVSWLWRLWVPGGALTLFEGDGGTGKSTVLSDLVAKATTGSPWPGETDHRDPISVIWIQAEEAEAEVLVPRLMAAGADRSRVYAHVDTDPWNTSQTDRLQAAIKSVDAGMVIIDPIKSFQSGADDNSETQVRASIQGLNSLGVPVIGVRHWNKGSKKASERGSGSSAYRNIAREAITLGCSPDSDGIIMAPNKCSLGRMPTPWELSIIDGPVIADDQRPVVRWKFERPDVTANMLTMDSPEEAGKGGKRKGAREAIMECLRTYGGVAGRAKVLEAANDAGASRRTGEAALSDLKKDGRVAVEKPFAGTSTVRLLDPRTD